MFDDPYILASATLATASAVLFAASLMFCRQARDAAHRAARAAGLANAERVAAWNAHDNANNVKLDAYSLACLAKKHAADAELHAKDAMNSRSKAHAAAVSCTADAERAGQAAAKSHRSAAVSTLAAIESRGHANDANPNREQPRPSLRIVLPFPSTLETPHRKNGKPDPAPWNHTNGEAGA